VNKTFSIELPSVGVIEFHSVEAQQISELLTDYSIAYLKELEMSKLRSTQKIQSISFTMQFKSKEEQQNVLNAVVKVQAIYRGFCIWFVAVVTITICISLQDMR